MISTPTKPVPVILASNALTRLWPVSSHAVNYALKGINGNKPALLSLLEAIIETDSYAPPIVFVQEQALKLAISIIEPLYHGKATIVATQPNVSSGILSSLAARIHAQKSISSTLVYLPATLTASDDQTLRRYVHLFAKVGSNEMPLDEDALCFVGVRASIQDSQLSFQLKHHPVQRGILPVDKIISAGPQQNDQDTSILTAKLQVIPCGPAIARASAVSRLLADRAPSILQACTHALDTGERIDNTLRPNLQFLTLTGRVSLADVIASEPKRARILMCGNDLETVRDWSSPFARVPKSNLLSAQIVGDTQSQIISYEDKLLLLSKDAHPQVKILNEQPNEARSEQNAARKIQRIESQPHSAVWRIELEPGQSLENECHFHRIESWSVASGQGLVHLDDNPMPVKAGATVIISPEVCHQITNNGDEPLVFYELRMGRMLEDGDRLFIPTKAIKSANEN